MTGAAPDHDVIVVGGGIAGLGAAYTFTRRGLDVVVLEREAEAGGRMRSRQAWDGLCVAEVAPEIPPLVEDRLLCRWKAAIPIFYPGYLRTLARFRALGPLPGVAFAGDYLAIPSMAAAHDSGQQAAAKLLADLGG